MKGRETEVLLGMFLHVSICWRTVSPALAELAHWKEANMHICVVVSLNWTTLTPKARLLASTAALMELMQQVHPDTHALGSNTHVPVMSAVLA